MIGDIYFSFSLWLTCLLLEVWMRRRKRRRRRRSRLPQQRPTQQLQQMEPRRRRRRRRLPSKQFSPLLKSYQPQPNQFCHNKLQALMYPPGDFFVEISKVTIVNLWIISVFVIEKFLPPRLIIPYIPRIGHARFPQPTIFLGMCLHFIPLHCTFASYFNLWGIPESIWHNLVHEIYEPRFEKVGILQENTVDAF